MILPSKLESLMNEKLSSLIGESLEDPDYEGNVIISIYSKAHSPNVKLITTYITTNNGTYSNVAYIRDLCTTFEKCKSIRVSLCNNVVNLQNQYLEFSKVD